MEKITKQNFISKIGHYFPPEALDFAFELFDKSNFSLKITAARLTKKGDFRIPIPLKRDAVITINGDMNPYEFLLVFIHEVAHYQVYMIHIKKWKKLAPHGIEWKSTYKTLMENLLNTVAMPEEVDVAFRKHILQIKSSSALDKTLNALFNKDKPLDENTVLVSTLQHNELFIFGHHQYRFKEKRRTRILCTRLDNRKVYLLSGQASVIILPEPKSGQLELQFTF